MAEGKWQNSPALAPISFFRLFRFLDFPRPIYDTRPTPLPCSFLLKPISPRA